MWMWPSSPLVNSPSFHIHVYVSKHTPSPSQGFLLLLLWPGQMSHPFHLFQFYFFLSLLSSNYNKYNIFIHARCSLQIKIRVTVSEWFWWSCCHIFLSSSSPDSNFCRFDHMCDVFISSPPCIRIPMSFHNQPSFPHFPFLHKP